MKLNQYKLDEDVAKESDLLKNSVFDNFITPIFQLAVDNRNCKLQSLPTFLESMDAIHILPLPDTKKMPPGVTAVTDQDLTIPQIQIKFRSTEYKSLICTYKKTYLEELNADGSKVHLIDDKTPVNASCMRKLRLDKRVDPMTVQLRNCRIKFKKKGMEKVFTVKDPFDEKLEDFI